MFVNNVEMNEIFEAITKATPEPMIFKDQSEICPTCNQMLRGYEGLDDCYCKFCGQHIRRDV